MASQGNQQTWMPYETTKDCSLGFCSVYCPQWCYIIFPPPPPFELADDSPSGPAFSPLVIAIIGILASAFLLVTYYAIISRYCGHLDYLLRHRRASNAEPEDPSARHEAWDAPPSDGLDEALINKISVYRYKRGEGLVNGTDCSVCLSQFREDESLRLLPKCSHAFHVRCIDTWLKSHSNCPLCRAYIVSVPLPFAAPPELLSNPPASQNQANNHDPVPAIEEHSHRSGEAESTPLENEGDVSKDTSLILCRLERLEERHGIVEIAEDEGQAIRRSFSMDDLHRGQASIADVLRLSMEEEFLAAEDHGLSTSAESSRHSKGGGRGRGLHNVMSPVLMKRSFSGGRFCLTKQGRGKNPLLPL